MSNLITIVLIIEGEIYCQRISVLVANLLIK